jgi:hypothetical protein
MAIACIGLAGCGAPTAATPTTTSAFDSESAGAIVDQARSAMASAGSVSASGSGSVNVPNVGKVTVTEDDYAGSTSGRQILSSDSAHVRSADLPSADTLDVDGAIYTNANMAFWASSFGLPESQAAVLANKWVQIPSSSALYAQAAADLTLSTLVPDLFDATSYHKSGGRTVDGVPAIRVTYMNRGGDGGPTTIDVAVGGGHLPVAVNTGGLDLHLTSWGKSVPVAAPQSSVPLSNLLPPGGSSGAITT